jgi:dihydroorotase
MFCSALWILGVPGLLPLILLLLKRNRLHNAVDRTNLLLSNGCVFPRSVSYATPVMATYNFLQVHGEVTDPHVDTFDREKVFIDTILAPLVQKLPQLKIVMEHITTMDAVNFVESCEEGMCSQNDLYCHPLLLATTYNTSTFPGHVAATVTPQHLLLNRNALFQGGLQPHNYCLPILKRETHSMCQILLLKKFHHFL